MNLYLAAVDREAAETFGRAVDTGDDADFDAAMAVFAGPGGINVGQAWAAVDAIVRADVPDLDPVWAGEAVSDDLGYGEAVFAPPERVAGIAAALAGLTAEEARDRLGVAVAAGAVAYPDIWKRPEEADANAGWAVDATLRVIALYQEAARSGRGLLAVLL